MTKEKREQIKARLQELADKNDGRLTPEQVVEDAKDVTSPLHTEFQWDDAKAAISWRLETARRIIRSVKVEMKTTKTVVTAVAYVRDPRAESDEQGYVSVEVLRDEKDMAKKAIREELMRVTSALERARSVAVGLDLEDELEALLALTASLQARVVRAQAA